MVASPEPCPASPEPCPALPEPCPASPEPWPASPEPCAAVTVTVTIFVVPLIEMVTLPPSLSAGTERTPFPYTFLSPQTYAEFQPWFS